MSPTWCQGSGQVEPAIALEEFEYLHRISIQVAEAKCPTCDEIVRIHLVPSKEPSSVHYYQFINHMVSNEEEVAADASQ